MQPEMADRAVDATVGVSVALMAVSFAHTLEIVQLVAAGLSCIGISVAIVYHIMKIRQIMKGKRGED